MKKKLKIKTKNQEGITLIALIITIIVMLILVAVTINMAINGGLFSYAGRATRETQDAIDAEKEIASGRIEVDGVLYNSINDYIETKSTPIKVGDYVNYTPDTGTYRVADGSTGSGRTTTDPGYQEFTTETGTSALKWRILSIDEATGKIEIVAETQSSTKLTLSGADGYNHAVDILNDLCETLYSKTEDGKKVATGRSINVEDVNAKTTYTPSSSYGTVKPLSDYSTIYRKYPNLYSQETGYYEGDTGVTGLSGSEGKNDGETDTGTNITTYPEMGYTDDNVGSKDVKFTYTYYSYAPESNLKDLGINTAPAGLIKTGTTYWLASRCVDAAPSYAYFDVRYVRSGGYVDYYVLFSSYGGAGTPSFAVRPVVSLASNVKLTKDTTNSTDSVTYWNISF